MKRNVTTLTERGQVSIPTKIRKQLNLKPGELLVWDVISPTECRVAVVSKPTPKGAIAMLGHAKTFRHTKTTEAWMDDLRGGERE